MVQLCSVFRINVKSKVLEHYAANAVKDSGINRTITISKVEKKTVSQLSAIFTNISCQIFVYIEILFSEYDFCVLDTLYVCLYVQFSIK